jgi:hypothetical protein
LRNFGVIADETDLLADNLLESCNKLNAMSDELSEITKRFEMIKINEDIVFKANILLFNVNLQIARTVKERQGELLAVGERVHWLVDSAVLKGTHIATLFSDLAKLLYDDALNQAVLSLKEFCGLLESLCAQSRLSSEEVRNAGFGFIGDELGDICCSMEESRRAIPAELSSDMVSAAIQRAKSTLDLLNNCFSKLEILAFSSRLDLTRAPDDTNTLHILDVLDKLTDEFCQKIGCLHRMPG